MRIPRSGVAAFDQMQLIVFANLQPDMPIIPKRIVDNVSADELAIKRRTPLKIGHVYRDVIEMRFLSSHRVQPSRWGETLSSRLIGGLAPCPECFATAIQAWAGQ